MREPLAVDPVAAGAKSLLNFVALDCCKCGIVFLVPKGYDANRQEDYRRFWCPNGHGQNYTKPDAQPAARNAERDARLKALHEQEQREARDADAAAKVAAPTGYVAVQYPDGERAVVPRESAEAIAAAVVRERIAREVADPNAVVIPPASDRRHRCPVCGHEFRTVADGGPSGHFRRHMLCRHRIEGDDFRAAVRRGLELAGKGVAHA